MQFHWSPEQRARLRPSGLSPAEAEDLFYRLPVELTPGAASPEKLFVLIAPTAAHGLLALGWTVREQRLEVLTTFRASPALRDMYLLRTPSVPAHRALPAFLNDEARAAWLLAHQDELDAYFELAPASCRLLHERLGLARRRMRASRKVTMSLPTEDLDAAEVSAGKLGISWQELVRRLVREGLERERIAHELRPSAPESVLEETEEFAPPGTAARRLALS